jgi:branched-chain amino acid transport system substrate-binding protein
MPEKDGFAVDPSVAFLVRVKAPSQSKQPWDYYYYDVLSTIPGKDAFMGESESGCTLP